jgi:hypothetical protein
MFNIKMNLVKPNSETIKLIFEFVKICLGILGIFSFCFAIYTYREARFNNIKPIFDITRHFQNKSDKHIIIKNYGGDVCFQGVKLVSNSTKFIHTPSKYTYLLNYKVAKDSTDTFIISVSDSFKDSSVNLYWSDADENMFVTSLMFPDDSSADMPPGVFIDARDRLKGRIKDNSKFKIKRTFSDLLFAITSHMFLGTINFTESLFFYPLWKHSPYAKKCLDSLYIKPPIHCNPYQKVLNNSTSNKY